MLGCQRLRLKYLAAGQVPWGADINDKTHRTGGSVNFHEGLNMPSPCPQSSRVEEDSTASLPGLQMA